MKSLIISLIFVKFAMAAENGNRTLSGLQAGKTQNNVKKLKQ